MSLRAANSDPLSVNMILYVLCRVGVVFAPDLHVAPTSCYVELLPLSQI